MDELERQLSDYAGQLDVVEPVRPEEILERAAGRTGNRRAFFVAAAMLVVVVMGMAALALTSRAPDGDDPVSPVDATVATTPPAPLRARVELPSDTLSAGGRMSGEVVVQNDTGAPIDTVSCVNLYGASLSSDQYSQAIVWPACAQPFQVPVGESRWPVVVTTMQSACAADDPRDGLPQCLPDGMPPSVPAGTYEVRVGPGGEGPPIPDPVMIEVLQR